MDTLRIQKSHCGTQFRLVLEKPGSSIAHVFTLSSSEWSAALARPTLFTVPRLMVSEPPAPSPELVVDEQAFLGTRTQPMDTA